MFLLSDDTFLYDGLTEPVFTRSRTPTRSGILTKPTPRATTHETEKEVHPKIL